MASRADLVFVDGDVVVVDADFSVVDAIAVSGGRVVALGADARSRIDSHTEVVDLAGRTLLPGINDSHLHGCAFGMSQPPFMIDVGFPRARSIADIAASVAKAATSAADGEWIVGKGWDAGYLDDLKNTPGALPHRRALDAAAPNNPVCLQDFTGHMTWANTAALARAGVDATTDPPAAGVIVRDADGTPTGVFQEGAQSLIQGALPPITRRRREEAIRAAIATLHAHGITSFTEPGLGPGGETMFGGAMGGETLEVYAELAAAGQLEARVSVLLLPCGLSSSAADFATVLRDMAAPSSANPRRLNVVGVKVFADGIPPNKTSWMYHPYADGTCGSLSVHGATEEERLWELTEIVRVAHAAGHQLGVHVTGDRGIDAVVDALSTANLASPRPDSRHYIIHGDFASPATLRKLAAQGFGANMNPAIKWTIADQMEDLLGPEMSAYQWPVRTAVDIGVRVMSSSDAPVTFPDWRQGISAMMLRESKASGRPSGPEQCVGIADAIRAYTSNAAWQDFAEGWKGSLEVGKVADFCVVDGPLLRVDAHDIPDLPIAMTVLDGVVVHDASR